MCSSPTGIGRSEGDCGALPRTSPRFYILILFSVACLLITSCHSDGSDGSHHHRWSDRHVVFARWRLYASPSNTRENGVKMTSVFCRIQRFRRTRKIVCFIMFKIGLAPLSKVPLFVGKFDFAFHCRVLSVHRAGKYSLALFLSIDCNDCSPIYLSIYLPTVG